jgi:hypothetical protein
MINTLSSSERESLCKGILVGYYTKMFSNLEIKNNLERMINSRNLFYYHEQKSRLIQKIEELRQHEYLS